MMNTKKFLATAAVGAGLVAGSFGVASLTSTSVAGAQTVDSSSAAAHPGLRQLRRAEFKVAAGTIGVKPAELRGDIKAGQSVADVATAHGVSVDDVVNAVVQNADAKLDHAVTTGKITQAQDDQIKAKLPARVTTLVNAHRTAPATPAG
jgi:hypothetical protein